MSGAEQHSPLRSVQPEHARAPRPGWPWGLILGLGLWIAAVGSAFWGQNLLTPRGQLRDAAVVYALAAVLAIVGMALIERQAPLPERPPPATTPATRWHWGTLVLLFAAFSATGLCMHSLQTQRGSGLAFWLWVGSLLLATVAMTLVGPRLRFETWRPNRSQLVEAAVLIVIVMLALALRVPKLTQIPPEVHGDEAQCGIEARRLLHGEVPSIFDFGWYGVPYFSFGISAAGMQLFGDNLYGLRMASVIQGALSILVVYAIVKRLFTARVAAVAAVLLAVSHWHIHFSRSGIHYMQALLATMLLFWFLLRAMDTQRPVDFLFVGFAAGLCFEVYFAARLAPVLAGVYLLHKLVSEPSFWRRRWTGLLAMACGAVLFLAPMKVAYGRTPQMLLYRTRGVFIFSPINQQHALEAYHVGSMNDVLQIQALNSLKAFVFGGDASLQYGHAGPLVDFWSAALFVLGGVVATVRARRAQYFFVVTWFWLTLIVGSVLTVDALFSPRVIAIIPVLFIFSALVVDAGWRAAGALLGRFGTYAFALPVAVFLLLAARANYTDYFDDYIQHTQPAGFNTALANFVQSINDRYQVYLISGNENWFQYGTERFLIPGADGVSVGNQPLALPLDRVPARKGVVFLVSAFTSHIPDTAERLRSIKEAYPGGEEVLHKTTTNGPLFYSYAVEHNRLVAAKPDAQLDDARIPGLSLLQVRQLSPTRAAPPESR